MASEVLAAAPLLPGAEAITADHSTIAHPSPTPPEVTQDFWTFLYQAIDAWQRAARSQAFAAERNQRSLA